MPEAGIGVKSVGDGLWPKALALQHGAALELLEQTSGTVPGPRESVEGAADRNRVELIGFSESRGLDGAKEALEAASFAFCGALCDRIGPGDIGELSRAELSYTGFELLSNGDEERRRLAT